MSRLANFEQELVIFAREKVTHLPPQFVNFISYVEAEYGRHQQRVSLFIDFPINQYRLIRRFSYDWPLWREELRSSIHVKQTESPRWTSIARFLTFYDALSKEFSRIDQYDPSVDVKVATYTISRIQFLYQNASGLLPSDQQKECPPLTEIEILELCAWSWEDNEKSNYDHFLHAFHWMTVFTERMKPFLPYSTPRYLIDYILKHADTYGQPKCMRKTLTVETFDLLLNYRRDNKTMQRLQELFDILNSDRQTQLCRHSEDRSQAGKYCFLFHSPRAPYAPFRYEILHRDPYVAIIHNFMPLQMADQFISEASAEDSKVTMIIRGNAKNTQRLKRLRLSDNFAFEQNHTMSAWLDNRVEHATRLLPNSQPTRFGIRDGECIFIFHYGLSGHFRGHYDYISEEKLKQTIKVVPEGDRLATVLVYLSDVRSGGHTVFPDLGVSLTPRSGSALVWFNLDPWSGKGLRDTLHVGCPVNVGKKWIINKWIVTHHSIRHSLPVIH